MLSQMAEFPSFSRLTDTLLYEYATLSLTIHLMMSIWAVSISLAIVKSAAEDIEV